ncbi:hypothetical protein BT96DRAFT_950225 [Gymnopus androsaceus JB14]|uniref:Uncharacterized protein n=1 Tax=Gymnopus androsaceus JB14 TaxID=1447944 RepID=A0A6A4GHV4_9AGAR|nr:hypothetical protein BT96DRAFT_950225 [Gymnopus androsaceus JB14]
MLVLDRYMVPEPQGDTDEVEMLKEAWYEREFQVHCCWPGLPHLPKYTDPGFSSQRGTYRIFYLKGLFDLVKAWPGVKPPELRRPFPQEDDHTALMEIEEILANYYLHLPFHMLETAVDGALTADRIATMLETFTDSHPHAHIMDHAAYNNAPGTERGIQCYAHVCQLTIKHSDQVDSD